MAYYYKFTASTPYYGTEQVELLDCEKPMTDAEIRELCDEYAYEVGESFEYLATGWEGEWESEEEEDAYYDDCSCKCVELTFEEWVEEMDNQGLI